MTFGLLDDSNTVLLYVVLSHALAGSTSLQLSELMFLLNVNVRLVRSPVVLTDDVTVPERVIGSHGRRDTVAT